MNKKHLFIAVAPLLVVGPLTGCSSSNSIVSLPFGKLYDSSLKGEEHFSKIAYTDFKTLVEGNDSYAPSSFALVVRGSSESCICWSSFRGQLETYCNKKNFLLYYMELADFNQQSYAGLDLKNEEHTLGIFDKGSLKYQVNVSDGSTYSSSYDVLSAWFDERITIGPLLYINKTQLYALYSSATEGFVVGYLRKKCPDCSYVMTHSVSSYSSSLSRKGYLIDCDVEGIRYYNGSEPAEEGTEDQQKAYAQWQSFKDEYGLSSKNTNFGFDNGYVPTFTYSLPGEDKAGMVEDAFVWGNESLTKNDDGTYRVTNAYLDGSRNDGKGDDNPFLTDNAKDILTKCEVKETNFLYIKSIPASDVTVYKDNGYWNHSASEVYDNPLLKAFLTYYLG